MDKHPRGLLALVAPALRKKVERQVEKARREMVGAEFKSFLAMRTLEKTLRRILYGSEYINPRAKH